MESEYQKHLKERFEVIKKFQNGSIINEKKAGGELFKEYINSLGSFPQWLTIFSGIAGFLQIFNKTFLRFAFVSFLVSALCLLYVKRSASKRISAYIKRLEAILGETSNLTYEMTRFKRGEISEVEMKSKEKSFDENYHEMRKNIYIENGDREDNLIDMAFWLSVVGSIFLVLALFIKC